MKTGKLNEYKFIILSFILASLIMLITYVYFQVYPFGGKTILRIDLFHQYAPFHEELRSRILNGQSLFFSWEGGLGKAFLPQLAYYTSSPLSFLILFFPAENLAEAMALLILLKIALSASTFSFYIKKSFNRNDLSITAFSLLYAFMAFSTAYYWNVMWLDAVALFPFVALGIESLVKKDTHKTYCVSLALVIITNFYMGLLVCIFSVLYFLVVLFSNYSLKNDIDVILLRMMKFGFISLLAGGITMFLAAPSFIALSQSAKGDAAAPNLSIYLSVFQLFANHFLGAQPVVLARNEDLPNIYSGTITLLLVPVFFMSKAFKRREKRIAATFIIFMILSCSVNVLDYTVHGMYFPANLPHRFTFVYSFFLLHIAYKAFINMPQIKEITTKTLSAIFCICIAVMLVIEFVIVSWHYELDRTLSNQDIAVNILLLIIYIFVLYNMKTSAGQSVKYLYPLITICFVAEAFISASTGLSHTSVSDRDKYLTYMDHTQEALEYIRSQDDGFYRTEFRRVQTKNDGALYHYKGFNQFSSITPAGTTQLVQKLGVASSSTSFVNYDLTPLLESVFNLKYIMNKDKEFERDFYDEIANFENIYLYQNAFWLPLGFTVNRDFIHFDAEMSNPFDVQNDFVVKATGINQELFRLIEFDSLEYENIEITEDIDTNYFKYKLTTPDSLSHVPSVNADLHNAKNQWVFLYVEAENSARMNITVGNRTEDREFLSGRSLFNVGQVDAGQEIKVSFKLDKRGEKEKKYRSSGSVKIHIASFDEELFEKVYAELNKNTMDVYEYGDTFVKGHVVTDEDGILFTSIPYQKGWSLKLDGVKKEILPVAASGFIGIELEQGEHIVELSYFPPGLILGIVISVVSIVTFIVYSIQIRKDKLL